jgi:hypothetical protein
MFCLIKHYIPVLQMYDLSEEELIVILTNKFAALENFHDTGDINRAWDTIRDCLCGLVVSVEGYKHRGPGFDSRAFLRIFLRELGLERGPLSLVIR